ncbi:hypothetical protein BJV82DRAFT_665801 [Fennellomyces sp. T-0311]|nr:hypothetical protein BJV82DRAFT_665801 [Fennellomyces sp. T-0311]
MGNENLQFCNKCCMVQPLTNFTEHLATCQGPPGTIPMTQPIQYLTEFSHVEGTRTPISVAEDADTEMMDGPHDAQMAQRGMTDDLPFDDYDHGDEQPQGYGEAMDEDHTVREGENRRNGDHSDSSDNNSDSSEDDSDSSKGDSDSSEYTKRTRF